jgi:hypothetical protein
VDRVRNVKALDYAIRTENWELAALCLVLGAVEALKELPPDAVDEMLGLLDLDEMECAPQRHERVLRRAQDDPWTGSHHGGAG